VLIKVGDDVSTDEIMPAGQRVLPYRSNIPKIAEFVYYQIDETYLERLRDRLEYDPVRATPCGAIFHRRCPWFAGEF